MKTHSAYTLIELLISITLSLFLLLGVTEMFRHVGSTMSDTQKSLNMSSNLNAVAMTLRSDLGKMTEGVAHKPNHMVHGGVYANANGYLEIKEGMNACSRFVGQVVSYTGALPPPSEVLPAQSRQHNQGEHFPMWWIAKNSDISLPDLTVGDVDDILAFTAEADPAYPFRGFIDGQMSESLHAEIIWFVRGTNLYRRILLLDDNNTNPNKATSDQIPMKFYERNDLSVRLDGGTIRANELPDLVRREYRFAHSNLPSFPFLIGGSQSETWYYLRMPLLEEMCHPNWPGIGIFFNIGAWSDLKYGTETVASLSTTSVNNYFDFWENANALNGTGLSSWQQDSKSGSILVENPRSDRAAEDLILKNVISFDVKVWNPYWVPCVTPRNTNTTLNTLSNQDWIWAPPQYVDLGQDRFVLKDTNDGVDKECFVNYYQNLNGPTVTGIPDGTGPGNRGIGFCSKGRYAGCGTQGLLSGSGQLAARVDFTSTPTIVQKGAWGSTPFTGGSLMPCTFDSWTMDYENEAATYGKSVVIGTRPGLKGTGTYPTLQGDASNWECPPPYDEDLQSIQITIRCFEPQSGNIKQIRVVQQFPDN